jgi:hypothetical protein
VFFSLKSILQDFKKLFAFFGVIKGLIKIQLGPAAKIFSSAFAPKRRGRTLSKLFNLSQQKYPSERSLVGDKCR